jgi:hypothetical protein
MEGGRAGYRFSRRAARLTFFRPRVTAFLARVTTFRAVRSRATAERFGGPHRHLRPARRRLRLLDNRGRAFRVWDATAASVSCPAANASRASSTG